VIRDPAPVNSQDAGTSTAWPLVSQNRKARPRITRARRDCPPFGLSGGQVAAACATTSSALQSPDLAVLVGPPTPVDCDEAVLHLRGQLLRRKGSGQRDCRAYLSQVLGAVRAASPRGASGRTTASNLEVPPGHMPIPAPHAEQRCRPGFPARRSRSSRRRAANGKQPCQHTTPGSRCRATERTVASRAMTGLSAGRLLAAQADCSASDRNRQSPAPCGQGGGGWHGRVAVTTDRVTVQ
jgi:hypothetical protein